MRNKFLLVMFLALSAALSLWAVTVSFTSAPSSAVNSGVSYTVAAAANMPGGAGSMYITKNGTSVAGNGGANYFSASVTTSDTGPQVVEFHAVAIDSMNGGATADAWTYVTINSGNSAPLVFLDGASSAVPVNGILTGSGWAADNEMGAPVTRVDILIDGNDVGDAVLGGDRSDVATAYGRSDYRYSGVYVSVNIGGLAVGSHTVALRAVDNQGASSTSASRTFSVTNNTPSITLSSPAGQTIGQNTALTITSSATDPDGNITAHNIDIQRPDGTWNFQGGFAYGEPFMGGPVGSGSSSTRSASFTFNLPGTWYIRSWVQDGSGNSLHSAAVAITVNDAPTISFSQPPPASPAVGTSFTARATGADVNGNLSNVQVDVSVNGGAWSAFAYNNGGNGYTNTSDGNLVTAGPVGTTYKFRARAFDMGSLISNGGGYLETSTVTSVKSTQPSGVSITSASSTIYGSAYTGTATGGNGTGALEWALGTGSTAPGAAINATSGAVTTTGVGTVVIKCRRLGDANYYDSAYTADFTITVNKAVQPAPVIGSAATMTYLAAYTATANAGQGALEWALGTGSTASGAAINATSGAVTTTGAGAVKIKARFAGNANYNPSAYTADFTITVNKAGQSAPVIGSAATMTYLAAYTATANAGQGALEWALGTGSTAPGAAINASTGAVTVTGVGAVKIKARFAGNANYNPSAYTADFTITVGKANQAGVPTVTGPVSPAFPGPFTATATGSGQGAVEWALGTGSTAPDAAINAGTGAVTSTGVGAVKIKARFAGNANYNASAYTADFTITVSKGSQSAPVIGSAATMTYLAAYTATANAGQGALEWALGTGSTAPGAAINASTGAVTVTGVGAVKIKARFAGNANYNASAYAADFTITVNKAGQSAPVIGSAATMTYLAAYTATATGGAGTGALQWALGSGSTAPGAAINATTGAVTSTGTGTVVIKVLRLGDSNYNASAYTADFPITVQPAAPADTTAPSAPTGLIVTGNTTGTSFTLSWTPSTDNVGVTAYEVKRGSTLLGEAAGASRAITGLTQDTNYAMSVQARDAAGNRSAWSYVENVTTAKDNPTLTVQLLNSADAPLPLISNKAVIKLGEQVKIRLVASSPNSSVSVLQWRMKRPGGVQGSLPSSQWYWADACWQGQTSTSDNPTFITLPFVADTVGVWDMWYHSMSTGAKPWNGSYPDDYGWRSLWTPDLVVDGTPPSVPTGLAEANKTGTSFTLSWTASTDNVGMGGYEVFRDSVSIGTPTSTTFNVPGLAPGMTYAMKVRARDLAGNWSVQSAQLDVTTTGGNQPPTVSLTAPADGTTYPAPAAFTLAATASDSDGTVTKVEFLRDGTVIGEDTTSPYSLATTLTYPGPYAFTARAIDNLSATTTSAGATVTVTAPAPTLPFLTGFETANGYIVGALNGQSGWTTTGATAVTNTSFATGAQSAVLPGNATPATLTRTFAAHAANPIVFTDVFWKLRAGTDEASSPKFSVLNAAQVALVQSGTTGLVRVFNGDGLGGGTWQATPASVTLDANGVTTAWVRVTLRLDYTTHKYDLSINGVLAAINVNFASYTQNTIGSWTFTGHASASTYVDDVLAAFENPVFADTDRDGMSDTWETAHGLNPGLDDRNDDPDLDGATNIQEYLYGTDPQDADSDDDGINDGDEINTYHTDPTDNDSDHDGMSDGAELAMDFNPNDAGDGAADSDGDGMSNAAELLAGRDPRNPLDRHNLPTGASAVLPTGSATQYLRVNGDWTLTPQPLPQ